MKYNEKQSITTINAGEFRRPLKKSILAMSGVLLATLGTVGVQAQESSNTVSLEEIVVTGTLIRGTEVTGSQTIGVTAEDIGEIGAANTNEILATVPQITNFFNGRTEEDPRSSSSIAITRPNLRNMPGFNSASGSVTLILMDGHRIAPMGVLEASIDADVFMGSTLQSVDIVTDGGSSLYGADAVAGVINFVTKDSFDGVQIDLNGSTGDEYDAGDVAITAGTSWDDGSIMVALSHAERDGFLNGDRDWIQTGFYDEQTNAFTPQTGTQCIEPVGTKYGWFYYGAYGIWTDNPAAPGTGFQSAGDPECDTFSSQTALQDQERDSLFLSFQQELTDDVSFGVKSYYTNRVMSIASYPRGGTAPAAVDVTVNPAALSQETIDQFGLPQPTPGENYFYPAGAGFSYGAHPSYENRDTEIEFATFGIAPELTINLKNGWQVRNTLYFGRSDNTNFNPSVNTVLQNDSVVSGALDPLDVASADSGLIRDILNWENKTQTVHELFLFRTVADGKLMDMPAGDLRMAAGFEVAEDRAKLRTGAGPIGFLGGEEYNKNTRDSTSFFAELAIPVLENLDLSLSARHDDYSDFGKTTNPNIGFNFTPTDWLSVFGHWGESFNAPTALDGLAVFTGRFAAQTVTDTMSADVRNEWDGMGNGVVILDGVLPGLEPQTAETWALGFEAEPIDGLQLSANYYNIEFVDILGQLGVPSPETRLAFPEKFIWNPTQELWGDLLESMANPDFGDGLIDPADPTGDLTYIYDRRTSNFSEAEIDGIDFAISYLHDTDIGTLIYGVSGNYQLGFDLTQGLETTDQLAYNPDLNLQGVVGWERDGLKAKVTLKYTGSSDADPAAVNQSSVDSYLTTDLFVGYTFQGGNGLTDGLSLRFNVDNVFDEDPPEYRLQVPNLNFRAFTLGRVFKLGITKTFF